MFTGVGKTNSERLHRHRRARPRHLRDLHHRCEGARGGTEAHRAASGGCRVRPRALERSLRHQDQHRRRGRLQDRHRAGREPGPRELDRSHPAPPGHLPRRLHRAEELAGPHGARECAAAHRGARHGQRRGTCHRLRRGGLFAGLRRDARIRHGCAALHLFLDDHALAGLRLQHARPHAGAAQDAGDAQRARSQGLCHAARAGPGP